MLGVRVGCGAAHAVVDVHGGDVVPERRERMPEARRIGATGDEARDPATRLDEVVGADERLDARCQRLPHTPSVTEAPVGPTGVGFSVAASTTWSAGGSSTSSGVP